MVYSYIYMQHGNLEFAKFFIIYENTIIIKLTWKTKGNKTIPMKSTNSSMTLYQLMCVTD